MEFAVTCFERPDGRSPHLESANPTQCDKILEVLCILTTAKHVVVVCGWSANHNL